MSKLTYILDNQRAVAEPDTRKWARWFKAADRRVRRDVVGPSIVSTVFLGVDHSLSGNVPMLYETMIFGGPLDGYQDRCSTWDETKDMHAKAVERARQA